MLRALQPHAEDKLHLRLHRARSVILTSDELVEIRAAQRTFEGAYMRTALSLFGFALVILKIFTSEFYAIGALLAVYGFCVLLVAIYRRHEGNRQFFSTEEELELSDEEEDHHHQSSGVAFSNQKPFGSPYRQQQLDVRMPGGGGGGGDVDDAGTPPPSALFAAHARRRRSTVVSKKKFRTSGNSVALLAGLSLGAYIVLLVLILTLKS